MNPTYSGGAAVILLFLPILLLAMRLRRRGGVLPARNRRFALAVAASIAMLGLGLVLGGANGVLG